MHKRLDHFDVPIKSDTEICKDYAGRQKDKYQCYADLDCADMKEEPCTPTEVYSTPVDDVAGRSFSPPLYSSTPAAQSTVVRIDEQREIHLAKEDYDRVGVFMHQLVTQLHKEEDAVMEGDIITSFMDATAHYIRDPLDIEYYTAIIYHVIASALLPGGNLIVTQDTKYPSRPEDRQITSLAAY